MRIFATARAIILFVLIFAMGGMAYIFSDEDLGAIHIFRGTGWVSHIRGSFESVRWNAGMLSFENTITDPNYKNAHLYGTGIYGYFWLETVWWAAFTGDTYISPPPVGSSLRNTWSASGYAWSDHAGIMTLTWEYFPDDATLSWYIWSDTLWYIALNTIADDIGLWFVGKVIVIGNVGSRSNYDINLPDYSVQNTVSISSVTNFINTVKKKVALNIRNADRFINTDFSRSDIWPLNGWIYYNNTGSTDVYVSYSTVKNRFDATTDTPRSLIVIGGDIYIDTGVVLWSWVPPRAIVALKNDAGKGWNIYIHGMVTRVHASLIADGTIYSARRVWTNWDFYNASQTRTTALPNFQLYIYGTVISRNTIWWAWRTTVWSFRCPFTESACSFDQAIRYDFNFFRDFQTGAIDRDTNFRLTPEEIARRRWYKDDTYDNKSLVIEYDPRIVSDPPPWL